MFHFSSILVTSRFRPVICSRRSRRIVLCLFIFVFSFFFLPRDVQYGLRNHVVHRRVVCLSHSWT